jgi:hypothetical protein
VSATEKTTPTEVVDSYFQMWNEVDGDRRLAPITRAWTQHYPGHRFRLTEPVEVHHDRARWRWEFVAPDGAAVVAGVDFVGFFPQPGGAA